MQKLLYLTISCLIVLLGCTNDHSEEIAQLKSEIAQLKAISDPPPSTLDNLYPPKAQAPIYLIKMYELASPFSAIILKANEGDQKMAKVYYEQFKTKYQELSKMVPMWDNLYPIEPLNNLGESIESGNVGKVMASVEKVAKVCHDCHITAMPKVQQKYHWGDFSEISLTDPVSNNNFPFSQYMMNMEISFSGIGVEFGEGKPEKALQHFNDFRKRFQELKDNCQICHETERKYFVDENVEKLIDKLGNTLKDPSQDPALIGQLSQQIGMESCGKCHLVHVPATYAKAVWGKTDRNISQ